MKIGGLDADTNFADGHFDSITKLKYPGTLHSQPPKIPLLNFKKEESKIKLESNKNIDPYLEEDSILTISKANLSIRKEESKVSPGFKLTQNLNQQSVSYGTSRGRAKSFESDLEFERESSLTHRRTDNNFFLCDEDTINEGNLSDTIPQDSAIDSTEKHEENFKKGQGRFQKCSKDKQIVKKKGPKTGKKAKEFKKKTKNKYDPHGRKKAAKEGRDHDEKH